VSEVEVRYMRILFDFQIFNYQRFGGVSRYFFEIIRRLQESSQHQVALALAYSDNEYVMGDPVFSAVSRVPRSLYRTSIRPKLSIFKPLKIPALADRMYNFLNPPVEAVNEKRSCEMLRRGGVDVFHPTYYNGYYLNKLNGIPYVLTVYDMIHEQYPEFFPLSDETVYNKKIAMDGAARIIAISNNTKRDLLKYYDIDSSKIDVIYLGNSMSPDVHDENISVPDKFLLFVGSRSAYKNFYFFVIAIKPILIREKDVKIVCTGSAFTRDEEAFFEHHGLRGRFISYFSDEKTLSQLYRQALLFIFPSQYEGFGIPVLEAFACGCPMALSNTGSLPEVGGDAALYFDPKSPDELRKAVEKILYCESVRRDLVEKGYRRLREFSWEKTMEETLKSYERAIAG